MKVTIITICYNSASTVADTVRSVAAQDHPDIEYIIVDGASKDTTLEVVKAHAPGFTRIISEKDRGIYDAMNKGVHAATGDIIGILNSDDWYADDHVISDVVKLFSTTGCDACYADLVYVNRQRSDKVVRRWTAGPYREGLFLRGWMPPHPTFFVKREVYERLGDYNTRLRSAADYELMLRFIHRHRIQLAYLPRVITRMRTGGQSNVSIGNRLRANQEDREAWRMNDLKPAWYTLTVKPLSKIFQYMR